MTDYQVSFGLGTLGHFPQPYLRQLVDKLVSDRNYVMRYIGTSAFVDCCSDADAEALMLLQGFKGGGGSVLMVRGDLQPNRRMPRASTQNGNAVAAPAPLTGRVLRLVFEWHRSFPKETLHQLITDQIGPNYEMWYGYNKAVVACDERHATRLMLRLSGRQSRLRIGWEGKVIADDVEVSSPIFRVHFSLGFNGDVPEPYLRQLIDSVVKDHSYEVTYDGSRAFVNCSNKADADAMVGLNDTIHNKTPLKVNHLKQKPIHETQTLSAFAAQQASYRQVRDGVPNCEERALDANLSAQRGSQSVLAPTPLKGSQSRLTFEWEYAEDFPEALLQDLIRGAVKEAYSLQHFSNIAVVECSGKDAEELMAYVDGCARGRSKLNITRAEHCDLPHTSQPLPALPTPEDVHLVTHHGFSHDVPIGEKRQRDESAGTTSREPQPPSFPSIPDSMEQPSHFNSKPNNDGSQVGIATVTPVEGAIPVQVVPMEEFLEKLYGVRPQDLGGVKITVMEDMPRVEGIADEDIPSVRRFTILTDDAKAAKVKMIFKDDLSLDTFVRELLNVPVVAASMALAKLHRLGVQTVGEWGGSSSYTRDDIVDIPQRVMKLLDKNTNSGHH